MSDDKIDIKKIKKISQELIEKIDPEANVDISPIKDKVVSVQVKTNDSQMLIGQNSETLLAIQHLLRVMVRRIFGEVCFVEVDVNDYRKKRKDYLRQLAITAANDVSLMAKEISLPPMNSYERRIIHMELSQRRDVSTESRGCDSDRRIVVKPV